MKKVLLLLCVAIAFTSCKEEAKPEEGTIIQEDGKTAKQKDGLKTFSGQFVYFDDAAVLQNTGSIYGVVINDKMHELNEMAKPFKKEDTDYVSVQVRGELIPKPKGEEGWPYRIDIKEIESVKKYEAKENEVIKLGASETN